MSSIDYKKITYEGLWKNNAALVQLLGLCPLLAVSNSAVNALGLGIATIMVLTLSNLCVSIIRHKVTNEIRLPAFVLIIASVTTCIELLMQAFTFELYQILGIFIPLIVTNCAVLGRADSFASKHKILPSMLDGFMIGSGFAIVLLLLGIVREILGQGTVFDNMDLLLGPIAENWTLRFTSTDYSFLFAVLPPGAFVIMGFIIAIKNMIDKKLADRAETLKINIASGNKRVRVTD